MRDKSFGIAMAVSVLWHAFLVFAVFIVILPKGFNFVKFPTVSFLGPILNEDAFRTDISSGQAVVLKSYKRTFEMLQVPKTQSGLILYKVPAGYIDSVNVNVTPSDLTQKKVYKFPKKFDGFNVDRHELSMAESYDGISIEGPLKTRQILFRPKLPVLDKTNQIGLVELNMEFRIRVSLSGNVISVQRLRSCGDPQTDTIMTRYLFEWKFVPLDTRSADLSDGVVNLNFTRADKF